jgi:FMN hydrolase / 5-amino-6-(5-phospho-D-ribitylamino)uracil phosphatase
MPKCIRAISFDADNTLWDFQKVMHSALNNVLLEMKRKCLPNVEDLSVEQMIAIRNDVANEPAYKSFRLEEIRKIAFERTLEYLGFSDVNLASELNTLYLHQRFNNIQLYNDVIPTLDSITSQYKLGLITNGNSYPEKCGLSGYFSFTVYAHDYGTVKPDPKLFQIALEVSNCKASEMVHVGDSLENDVSGAIRAGLYTIWLNREGQDFVGDIQPHAEIRSLYDLSLAISKI